MPQACANCGTPNADAAKFCNECGGRLGRNSDVLRPTRVVEPRSAPGQANERRVVSVLFADIKDYTSLTEAFDPEQIEDSVGALFREFAQVIARHGGYVDKFMGDSVLALFGAPRSYGDDADRAVLCGLEMQRVAADRRFDLRGRGAGRAVQLQVRIGIETGEVVVGNLGQRGEYTAIGDAVNTANRIQAACEPGTVLIGEETAQLVRARYKLSALPPTQLKGKAGAVALYRVEGALKQTESYTGRFIGRSRELDLLAASFEASRQDKKPRFMLVRGEAGMGKSRLLYEFRRRLRAHRLAPVRLTTAFAPVGLEPLHGMRQLARAALGVGADAARDDIAARVAEAASRSVTADEAGFFSEQMGFLLGLDSGAEPAGFSSSQRAEIAGVALKRLIESLSAEAPVLLVFEDLHWIDAESLAFLRRLARSPFSGAALVLALGRPEAIELVRELLANPFEVVDLRPLAEPELAQLSEGVLRQGAANAELCSVVAERSGGNPFVAEELFKSLHETGMLALTDEGFKLAGANSAALVPAGVRSILAARIDALDPDSRAVLAAMSVIGREFRENIGAHLCGPNAPALLNGLVERGLLVELGDDRGQRRFQFCHALLHDVAYSGLLKRDKLALHRQAAEFFGEIQRRENVTDPHRLARRAYHLSRSEQPAEAAALYFQAGKNALADWQAGFAVEQLTRAKEEFERAEAPSFNGLTPRASRVQLLLALTEACTGASRYELALRCVDELARLCGDDQVAERAKALELAAGIAHQTGRFDDTADRASRAADLYRAAGREADAARMMLQKARSLAQRGRAPEADAIADAIGGGEAGLDDDTFIEYHHVRAVILHEQGKFSDALRHYRVSLQRAEQAGKRRRIAGAHANIATCLTFLGQYDEVPRHFELALNAYRASGDIFNLAISQTNYGSYLRRMKRFDEAITNTRKACEMSAELGDELGVVVGGNNIGACLMNMGDYYQAAREFQRVVPVAERVQSPQARAELSLSLARVALRMGETALIGAHLDRARQLGANHGMASLAHAARLIQAEDLIRAGRLDEAAREARAILALPDARKAQKFGAVLLLLQALAFDGRARELRAVLEECAAHLRPDPDLAQGGETADAHFRFLADSIEGCPIERVSRAASALRARLPENIARDVEIVDSIFTCFAATRALCAHKPSAERAQAAALVQEPLNATLSAVERGGRQDLLALVSYGSRAALLALRGERDAAEAALNLASRLAQRLQAPWLLERLGPLP